MRRIYALLVLSILALTACGGRNVAPPTLGESLATSGDTVTSQARQAKRRPTLGNVHFTIKIPKRRSHAHFVSPSTQSATITLMTVNGNPPPGGLTTTVTSNVNSSNCASGCTVAGPPSPLGNDAFAVALNDQPGGKGALLALGNVTIDVKLQQNSTGVVAMQGFPASISLQSSMPTGSGGTAFSKPLAFVVNVLDADKNVITGTYADPVTVTDSDTSSLTLGTALAVGAGTPATSVTLNGSADAAALTLNYGGLDIAPATISASTAAVSSTVLGTFSPSVPSIAYSGPSGTISNQEVDLAAQATTGGWTDSQAGWTNAPYNMPIKENDNCTTSGNSIATLAATGSGVAGTAWTATAANNPVEGQCTTTLTGGAGATLAVTVTYTSPIPVGIGLRRAPR